MSSGDAVPQGPPLGRQRSPLSWSKLIGAAYNTKGIQ